MSLWGSSLWPADEIWWVPAVMLIIFKTVLLLWSHSRLPWKTSVTETLLGAELWRVYPSQQIAVEGKWSEIRICMCLYPRHSDSTHGSTVLEKLTLKWSIQNIKDNGLHMYAKSCPGIIQLLPVLDFNQSKEKNWLSTPNVAPFFKKPNSPLVAS